MTRIVRVACCQISPDVLSPQRNAELTRAAIATAVDEGAQLVVLPELAHSGYVFSSVAEAHAAATPRDGEVLQSWAAEAARGDALVVGGFCELGADGQLFNSSVLLSAEGVLAVYHTLHLWGEEPRWFAAGEEPAPVVLTPHGLIGLAVCYDLEFPELTRGLALQGAELIVVPTNWPHEHEPPDGRPIIHSLAAMTAYWNKVFVAVCDRCETERGLEFEGGSVIAGPDGAMLAGPVANRGVETIYADCDLAQARDKRNGEHNDAFADRRAEHYAAALTDVRVGVIAGAPLRGDGPERIRGVLAAGERAEITGAYDPHAQLATLVEAAEDAAKSRRWRMRARIGERKRWYEQPEETPHHG
jgi:predicted amidohydrolase